MKQIELRLIDRELPEVWDYDEEVKKAQKLARRWATVTTQFLQTLWTGSGGSEPATEGKTRLKWDEFQLISSATWTSS